MFEHFVVLQEKILTIVARSEQLLRDPHKRDVDALGQARWELARTLREYQLFKHTRIFDPIMLRQDFRALQARRMKAECIRVGDDFRKYVMTWSVVSIVDHWDEYQPAALSAISIVRNQLAKERTGVADLLEIKSAAA